MIHLIARMYRSDDLFGEVTGRRRKGDEQRRSRLLAFCYSSYKREIDILFEKLIKKI